MENERCHRRLLFETTFRTEKDLGIIKSLHQQMFWHPNFVKYGWRGTARSGVLENYPLWKTTAFTHISHYVYLEYTFLSCNLCIYVIYPSIIKAWTTRIPMEIFQCRGLCGLALLGCNAPKEVSPAAIYVVFTTSFGIKNWFSHCFSFSLTWITWTPLNPFTLPSLIFTFRSTNTFSSNIFDNLFCCKKWPYTAHRAVVRSVSSY